MIDAPVIVAPLLVEVALTFALLFWAGALRIQALPKGEAGRDLAFRDVALPPEMIRLGEAFRAELELPILFYLAVVLTNLTATASIATVLLSWLFVATRLAHALIHLTTNDRARRFYLYWGGAAALLLVWLVFAIRILFGV